MPRTISFCHTVLSSRRGQSLVLALLIMFLLVFIGGLFVTLIARNVSRAQRSGDILTSEYLAEAAVRYADDQLSYSTDGADWRPQPTFPRVVELLSQGRTPQEIVGLLAYPERPVEEDPDFRWLIQGFSRYSYGNGRFLLRVTYDPRPHDPISKFIKIEGVGRVGIVDENDPTTWSSSQPMRARREKVAYKAIGITDYARFITNKDRRSGELALGTPEFITHFGDPVDRHGGSIRVNGNLVWHGEKNHIWLDPIWGEGVEVAGDIRHSADSGGGVTEVLVNNTTVLPSSDGGFSTIPLLAMDDQAVGSYRDGRMDTDSNGWPRSVFRLDPPLVDANGPANRTGRYRDLTRNSGQWRQRDDGEWYNTGYYGWGDGFYINNGEDIQRENIIYTLRGDWTNPGGSDFWRGPYYTPPAVTIILTPYDLDDDGLPDMRVIRDSRSGAKYIWYDIDGEPMTGIGEEIVRAYPRNGVIFAEGNVRIKGTLPESMQLTVVSGGTIYVDGSILKYRHSDGKIDDTSAIALLATDYICVNTTQFFSPVRGVFQPGNAGASEPHFEVSPGLEGSFWIDFAFGKVPQVAPQLYVRHTSDGDAAGASFINMLVNFREGGGSNPWYGVYPFFPGATYPYTYVLNGWREPLWLHDVFALPPPTANDYDFFDAPGVYNRIGFQFDQSPWQWTPGALPPPTKVNHLMSRVAVQPCDITIEAVLYAQNGSFFVIPGEWFNPDANDIDPGARPPYIADERWPLHGEPLDVQITIRGAVSENLPASVSDARAWMDKWGWIPPRHGSSSDMTTGYREPLDPSNANGRQRGLTFVYDGLLSFPKLAPTSAGDPTTGFIRKDTYGRLLPITPSLPVSPQTLYFGEPG